MRNHGYDASRNDDEEHDFFNFLHNSHTVQVSVDFCKAHSIYSLCPILISFVTTR